MVNLFSINNPLAPDSMKAKAYLFILVILFSINLISNTLYASNNGNPQSLKSTSDDVETLKSRLMALKSTVGEGIYSLHFQSIIDVIEAKTKLTATDSLYLSATLTVFSDTATNANAGKISSYLDRSRYLTISWVSPTDGAVSFFRLRLPKEWDKNQSYPLYVDLHGLSSTADNPIDFLTRYYRALPDPTIAFEDGYQIAPLARGNYWYQGISETDVWEAIDVIESLVSIDQTRKYLVGHSMGGYGTWSIASKSADVWAAIGIEAGALWYGDNMLTNEKVQSLSQMPTYFVVGTNDGLYDVNLQAYNLLVYAGNPNIAFVTFNGGHEKLTPNVENMYLWIREFVNEDYTAVENQKVNNNVLSFYPNLVQAGTTFNLKLETPEHVELILFDSYGGKVSTIVNDNLNKGESTIQWDRGQLPSGIYIYSLKIGKTISNGKLVLY